MPAVVVPGALGEAGTDAQGSPDLPQTLPPDWAAGLMENETAVASAVPFKVPGEVLQSERRSRDRCRVI